MKRFRDRYTDAVWGPNALRPNETIVALAYAKYAGAIDKATGEKAPENVSWVTWETLSTMTGIRSKDALNRAMKGLVDAGWLALAEKRRQQKAPRYKLTIPADPEVRGTYITEVRETDN